MGRWSVQISKAAEVRDELIKCSFAHWYPNFEKIAIRGTVLNIPANVVAYLQDELVVLPRECYPKGEINDEWNSGTREETSDDEEDAILEPEFPDFSGQIAQAIGQLRGRCAFVKTQWHCPKDAFWITAGQTLKVTDITDVYQLLKASSIVKQDLCQYGLPDSLATAASQCPVQNQDHFLVLKEWLDIHPGTEFRCFVRERSLIAISPREWPAYHQHIVQKKLEICNDIVSVYKEKIKRQFPMANYVFDIVRLAKDQVLLIDFSPFNAAVTDSLAFDWSELLDVHKFFEEDDPEFRYLPNDCGIQPSKRNNYGIPIDIVDMFHGNRIDGDSASNLSQLVNRIEEMNS